MSAQGESRFPSTESYNHRNGGGGLEIWRALGCQNQTAFGTSTIAFGALRSYQAQVARGGSLDRLAHEITTLGASAVGRVGLYRATSLLNIFPSALVVDGGEVDQSTTGVKAVTVAVFLSAGIYSCAYHGGVANVVARRFAVANWTHAYGANNTLAVLLNMNSVTTAYAALPATHPASVSVSAATTTPLVAVRYS